LIAGSASFTLLGLVNSYFLGPLGAVPLAAASMTTSMSIIIYGALFGLIGPIGYLIGTAYGAGDAPKIAEVIKHGVYSEYRGSNNRALFVIDERGTVRWGRVYASPVNSGVDGILRALEHTGTTEDATPQQADE